MANTVTAAGFLLFDLNDAVKMAWSYEINWHSRAGKAVEAGRKPEKRSPWGSLFELTTGFGPGHYSLKTPGSGTQPVLAHRGKHFKDFGWSLDAQAGVGGVGRDLVGAAGGDDAFFPGNRELQLAF